MSNEKISLINEAPLATVEDACKILEIQGQSLSVSSIVAAYKKWFLSRICG